MAVFRIEKSNWCARACITAGGKQLRRQKSGFATKKEAEAWEREQVEQLRKKYGNDPAGILPHTVEELHEAYVAHEDALGRSPATIDFYVNMAKHYLPVIGHLHLADLSPHSVQVAVDAAVKEGLAPHSVRGVHRALSATIAYGVRIGACTPVSVKVDLPKANAHNAHVMSAEDVSRMLRIMREEGCILYFPAALSVLCALRRGEAIGLRWQDIEWDAGVAHIRANLAQTDKRGAVLKTVKTYSSDAEVVLPEGLLADMRTLAERRKENATYAEGSPSVPECASVADVDFREFVCLGEECKPFRPGGMAQRLRRWLEYHDFARCTWHGLRHTYGTLLAEAGTDIRVISAAMRHSNLNITATQYIAKHRATRTAATEKIGDLIKDPGAANTGSGSDTDDESDT